MAINQIKYGNTTLIDLTGTTATADKILTGYGAYGKDGVWMDGSATGAGAVADEITQLQGGGDWHNVYGVDLTLDTVAADKLLSGYTAHNSAGTAITGTYEGNSASYGTFTVYSDNSTTRNYIRYSTMLVRSNIYYPALVPLKASTAYDSEKLGRALVNSTDGLLYVLFYSNAGSDTYTPSVTADSGTCTLVYLGSAGGTFDNHTIWATGTQGPYALYKVSVGAVLNVTHYNNS